MPPGALRAQGATGVLVRSLGQPSRWDTYVAALGATPLRGDGAEALGVLGAHRFLSNPVTGLYGVTGEGFVTGGGVGGLDGGARLLAASRALALGAGVDWRAREGNAVFVLSYQSAIRRGGLVGRGTMLRLDWLPARGQTIAAGLHVPIRQPFAGRTRPRHTAVGLPEGDVPRAGAVAAAADAALRDVESAAALLRAYTDLASPADERLLLDASAARARAADEGAARAYAAALERAFGAAAGDTSAGRAIAARARVGLLERVLVPFDAAFGRPRAGGIGGLTADAHARFSRWLADSSGTPPAARGAVLAVHARWMGVVEHVYDDVAARRRDSRTRWLPLRLALAPEQFDEQSEVDSLVARLVGRPFTDNNDIAYLRSGELPLEIARSIYAARDYHLLWTHDFAGVREETGELDDVAFEMVADAYLPALAEAVKRYDATGRLPVFMIFVDQYFYEPRRGRIWLSILEDPLGASVNLPGQTPQREAHLRQRQAELRAAVAASRRLQAEAARSGGQRWLRRAVKVHVSVTHPADFSFRSHRIVPPLPMAPDNIVRDHRKLVLYDVTEADPYRGAMLLMGVGIGEHYASPSWEDRGVRVRGPAVIEARAAARRLLREHGFGAHDIPVPLREATSGAAAERRANERAYVGRALQVHNEVGFAGPKEASVVRAALYDLATPGTILVAPDPMWLSEEWGAMLVAAAARGVRVHVVAPALANAPSPQGPLMALQHDVLAGLVEQRRRLAPALRATGGELRVGIFAATAQATDAEGRRREIRAGLDRAGWLRELFPFDARTLAVLERAVTVTTAEGAEASQDVARDVEPRAPQLHQKTQLVARPGAIAALLRQPGWEDVLARSMEAQADRTTRFADQLARAAAPDTGAAAASADAGLRAFEQAIPEAERQRVSFYFLLGTQNQDPRGMMLDGEATLAVSGYHAAHGLADLYFLMARSFWIETTPELERYVPAPSALMRRLARLVRPAL